MVRYRTLRKPGCRTFHAEPSDSRGLRATSPLASPAAASCSFLRDRQVNPVRNQGDRLPNRSKMASRFARTRSGFTPTVGA
jgi:hypothetical protein